LLAISLLCHGLSVNAADDVAPVVEVEEDIYSYTNAQNGAGPMWCSGSTTLVRTGDRLFASGLETIPDAKPLNKVSGQPFRIAEIEAAIEGILA